MKNIIIGLVVIVGLVLSVSTNSFATPATEKSFTDAYKKAIETKDEATLKSFLYTKGADPTALGFYTMMVTAELGGKVSSIELRALTQEDLKKAMEMQPLPSGKNAKLTLTPTKKLVVKIESSDANGTSTSTSESFVAEVDGKFVIPVPGPVS